MNPARAWRHAPLRQYAQASYEQQVLLYRRLHLLGDQSLGHLEHRRTGRIAGVVVGDGVPEGRQRLRLGDDLQGPAMGELHIDVHERLEARPELRLRPPHSLAHCTHPAGVAREEGDDPVGLTQLLGTQHDCLVAVQVTHCTIVSKPACGTRSLADPRAAASPVPD